MLEIVKFVVDADVVVIIVVLAKGIVLARPSPRIVVVAVRPTYSVSRIENNVDDALPFNTRSDVVAD